MSSHLTSIQERLENIRHEADQLEQQVESEATQWKLSNVKPSPQPTPNAPEERQILNHVRGVVHPKSGQVIHLRILMLSLSTNIYKNKISTVI